MSDTTDSVPTVPKNEGGNSAPTMHDFLKHIDALGRAFAKGVASHADLAQHVCDAAASNLIRPQSKTSDDVKTAFKRFQAQQGDDRAGTLATEKVQVSKLNAFALLGACAHANGPEVLRRCRSIINDDKALKASTYENMAKVARAQTKSQDEFDDDAIRAALQPNPAKEKDELARLQALLKAADRIRKGTDDEPGFPSEQIDEVILACEARIAVLQMSLTNSKVVEETAKRQQILAKYAASKGEQVRAA